MVYIKICFLQYIPSQNVFIFHYGLYPWKGLTPWKGGLLFSSRSGLVIVSDINRSFIDVLSYR